MALNTISHHSSGSGVFPALMFVQGNEQKSIILNRTPVQRWTEGGQRSGDRRPRALSRDHAQIMQEGQDFFLVSI